MKKKNGEEPVETIEKLTWWTKEFLTTGKLLQQTEKIPGTNNKWMKTRREEIPETIKERMNKRMKKDTIEDQEEAFEKLTQRTKESPTTEKLLRWTEEFPGMNNEWLNTRIEEIPETIKERMNTRMKKETREDQEETIQKLTQRMKEFHTTEKLLQRTEEITETDNNQMNAPT